MKYYVAIFLVCFLFASCEQANQSSNSDKVVSLNLSKKELTKLFKGQELYSIKGIKSKFEGIGTRVKSLLSKDDYILLLDFKDLYYEGAKEILLHSNTTYFDEFENLKNYIESNKLIWPKTELVSVNFSDKIQKDFALISVPDKESIEYEGKRFVQILSYLSTKEKVDLEKSEIPTIVNFDCFDYDYKSMVVLYTYLKKTGITFNSVSDIKMIPNPITNTLEFLPDFGQISVDKSGVNFYAILSELEKMKAVDRTKFNEELKQFESSISTSEKQDLKEVIFEGVMNVREDIRLADVHLKVKPNTTINMFGNAKIIVDQGKVSFEGLQDMPINVKGNGENSIMISGASSCTFNHTKFDGLSNWADDCKTVPSAITVYNSKSEFNFCEFRNNKRGDDMINLFQSTFKMDQCWFENTLSDALDSDFSQGTITNTTFTYIGNDAVDCSGSLLDIESSTFEKVSDKAISAGEKSFISVTKSIVQESAIGYVSKDGSHLKIEGFNELKNNDLDFAVFVKKPFYKKPEISFNGEIKKYKYLIQEQSIVHSEDVELIFLKEVESKLYGNEYGKSSK